jgi:hypothetical protein
VRKTEYIVSALKKIAPAVVPAVPLPGPVRAAAQDLYIWLGFTYDAACALCDTWQRAWVQPVRDHLCAGCHQRGRGLSGAIFTPLAELPFAGHPTIGTAHALLEAGRIAARNGALVQEYGAGHQ